MNEKLLPRQQFTERFTQAVQYAMDMHGIQTRKSSDISYVCDPLGVAAAIIEAGGDEDQAIGGLLHDVAEDCGGEPRLIEILEKFGPRVASIVRGCSDSLTESDEVRAPWKERKLAHLPHLENAGDDVLMVTAADKLNNARAIATDYQIVGDKVWTRFNAEVDEIIWYYVFMLEVLEKSGVISILLKPLESAIKIFSGAASGKARD